MKTCILTYPLRNLPLYIPDIINVNSTVTGPPKTTTRALKLPELTREAHFLINSDCSIFMYNIFSFAALAFKSIF